MAPLLTTVTGSIYNAATGQKRTSGRLYIQPQAFIISSTELVSPARVSVDIPGTGDLSFTLVPSTSVKYVVEFDPDPTDTITPLRLKSGYFRNLWTVPTPGPVNIASL